MEYYLVKYEKHGIEYEGKYGIKKCRRFQLDIIKGAFFVFKILKFFQNHKTNPNKNAVSTF
jgi:hypothetical protein